MKEYGQWAYITELKTGPKTTRDIVLSLMVCRSSVSRMMQKLRKRGIVKSSRVTGVRGNVWRHELIEGWDTKISNETKPAPSSLIPKDEVRHVAMLRNRGLVGQRLHSEHIKAYPARPYSSMHYFVEVARKRGLCR